MGVLARADAATIEACLPHAPALPAWVRLRGPETGLVMVRGRQGGDGAPFNLGEITVTRCTVRMGTWPWLGHGYVAGRDARHAELAAALDAVLQDPAQRAAWLAAAIEPLDAARRDRADRIARQAAATRVRFDALTTMR